MKVTVLTLFSVSGFFHVLIYLKPYAGVRECWTEYV